MVFKHTIKNGVYMAFYVSSLYFVNRIQNYSVLFMINEVIIGVKERTTLLNNYSRRPSLLKQIILK